MIAIKDMEMPSSCISCNIRSGSYCYAKNKPPYNIKGNLLTRDDDCPLIETEERKVGKWIYHEIEDTCRWLECSECGYEIPNVDMNYCPNCGAEMRGAK
ncbi:zinc-ribbon domain-containing protein [Pseudobutyrivibrio sp.]